MARLLEWIDPPNDWLAFFEKGLQLLFKNHPPAWLPPFIGLGMLIASAIVVVWMFLKAAYGIASLIKEKLLPLLYDGEKKRAVRSSQQFAEHLEGDLRRLNSLEQWSDFRYAELEAEVEYEGLRKGIWPFTRHSGVSRERNLSRALLSSRERLILLEGYPGTGKSVALRHLALASLKKTMRARRLGTVTPIYINLKTFELERGERPSAKHIRLFVLSVLNKPDDRDVDIYIEQNFDERVRTGGWLFLFDSFDEIPAVLSATDADTTVVDYANAIADFMSGMNSCRAIVASREFKGPTQLGWPSFRILPLTKGRQRQLMDRARLSSAQENALWADLELASPQVQEMSGNAMFLGILCEYIKTSTKFPESVHSVFDLYIRTRLERDRKRLTTRFAITEHRLRRFAEEIAFCMLADSSLGLSPTRDALLASHAFCGFDQTSGDAICLDALEYIKLARQESGTVIVKEPQFTFAHRRFQEYFATCVVLREPGRISPENLLTDGRWRETAVAMFQMQSIESLEPLQTTTYQLLKEMMRPQSRGIVWPAKSLHLLSLLQDGFMSRSEDLNESVRGRVSRLVKRVWATGTMVDRKWALQNAGCVDQKTLTDLIERSLLEIGSPWIEEVAYRQAARLNVISPKIGRWIRMSLIRSATSIDVFKNRLTTRAFLTRLPESSRLVTFSQALGVIKVIDLLAVALSVFLLINGEHRTSHRLEFMFVTCLSYILFWVSSDVLRLLHRLIPGSSNISSSYLVSLFWGTQLRVGFAFGAVLSGLQSHRHRRMLVLSSWHSRPSLPNLDSIKLVMLSAHAAVGLIIIFLLVWTPVVFYTLAYRERINLMILPIYPFIVILDFAKSHWRWQFALRVASITVVFVCLGSLTMVVMYILSSYVVIVGALASSILLYRILVLIADSRRFRKWSSLSQIKSGDVLCNILLDFKSSHYRTKLLRLLRTSNRLTGMRGQVLPDLEKLADVWAPSPYTRHFRRSLASSKARFGIRRANRDLKKKYSRRETLLNRWDSTSRDELFKLIEQLRQIPI